MSLKSRLKRAAISSICRAGFPAWTPSVVSGIGSILMLHRVRPDEGHSFAPNATLDITPAFLQRLIERLRRDGVDIVSLDEAAERLRSGERTRRFVSITLDDGYADNDEYARPIFERMNAPYAIYLTTGLPDRTATFWWLILEEQVRKRDHLKMRIDAEVRDFTIETLEQKMNVYKEIYQYFRALPEEGCVEASKWLCDDLDVDPAMSCAEHGLTWEAVQSIAQSKLGHIEAHTTAHMAVSRQTRAAMIGDIGAGIDRIAAMTGVKPQHFAYPFGDPSAAGSREYDIARDLPLISATTAIDGVLKPHHQNHMLSLPRVIINGLYQSDDYLDLVCSGIAPLLAYSAYVKTTFDIGTFRKRSRDSEIEHRQPVVT